jgi:hypothetical protein
VQSRRVLCASTSFDGAGDLVAAQGVRRKHGSADAVAGVNWAKDFEFDATLGPRGAIAQLGERLAGSQKVAGSSPAGSTL